MESSWGGRKEEATSNETVRVGFSGELIFEQKPEWKEVSGRGVTSECSRQRKEQVQRQPWLQGQGEALPAQISSAWVCQTGIKKPEGPGSKLVAHVTIVSYQARARAGKGRQLAKLKTRHQTPIRRSWTSLHLSLACRLNPGRMHLQEDVQTRSYYVPVLANEMSGQRWKW